MHSGQVRRAMKKNEKNAETLHHNGEQWALHIRQVQQPMSIKRKNCRNIPPSLLTLHTRQVQHPMSIHNCRNFNVAETLHHHCVHSTLNICIKILQKQHYTTGKCGIQWA